MSKYEPLAKFLQENRTSEIPMTFAEIEKVIGFNLPEKASGIRAWWSNNSSNNVMTKAWLSAGYMTERVDMDSRRLVFRRMIDSPRPTSTSSTPPPSGRSIGFLDRIRRELGGTVTIMPGVDLTEPTGEIWDAER